MIQRALHWWRTTLGVWSPILCWVPFFIVIAIPFWPVWTWVFSGKIVLGLQVIIDDPVAALMTKPPLRGDGALDQPSIFKYIVMALLYSMLAVPWMLIASRLCDFTKTSVRVVFAIGMRTAAVGALILAITPFFLLVQYIVYMGTESLQLYHPDVWTLLKEGFARGITSNRFIALVILVAVNCFWFSVLWRPLPRRMQGIN